MIAVAERRITGVVRADVAIFTSLDNAFAHVHETNVTERAEIVVVARRLIHVGPLTTRSRNTAVGRTRISIGTLNGFTNALSQNAHVAIRTLAVVVAIRLSGWHVFTCTRSRITCTDCANSFAIALDGRTRNTGCVYAVITDRTRVAVRTGNSVHRGDVRATRYWIARIERAWFPV